MTTSVEEQRIYTDEDVDVLIAGLLRARGFNVLTTRDAGQLHATVGIFSFERLYDPT